MPNKELTPVEAAEYLRHVQQIVEWKAGRLKEVTAVLRIDPQTAGQTFRCEREIVGNPKPVCARPGSFLSYWRNDTGESFIDVHCKDHAPNNVNPVQNSG